LGERTARQFRRGHRHADRLVAGLRLRVLDLREFRRLADIRDPLGGAAAGQGVTAQNRKAHNFQCVPIHTHLRFVFFGLF
jgi:hypothetical protein